MPGKLDMTQADTNWKAFVRAEDDSIAIWKNNWGWLVDEYSDLKKKLDEKSEQSTFLSGVKEITKVDNRQLGRMPASTNHMYGWVAGNKEFILQKYGSDSFKALPLPELYFISKR